MTHERGCFQQTLYDAGEVAIPIDDGIASKEGGFAAFVGSFGEASGSGLKGSRSQAWGY